MALSGDAQQGTIISSSGAVNSLNDQSEQISSRFWYDELGRLILSQNARQFICTDCPATQQEIGAKAYSYTLYDEVGRIVQVGELLSTIEPTTYKNRSQIKYENHRSFVENTSNYRHQVTTTQYNRASDRTYAGFTPTYLRNRVAYTTYQQNPSAQVQESHYSYDVHGNVKSMLQVIRGDGEELTKRIDYEYDLVSGKVNKVTYQKDNSDQFIHQYTYDGDNRIIQVATSTDDIVYTKEATYQYYAHGPLARINYGELNVEMQDFAYTIQGWIKQVQGQVFAYALGYNNTDYTSIGANPNPLPTDIATGQGLYNGNIATMSSKTQAIDAGNPWTQQFTYDQLNRIKTSTTQGNNQFATSYSYDANGNILNLTRKDYKGDALDNLTYNYENKSSGYQRNTNRLRSVDDAVATTGQTDDIEDQQEDNYRYDATGNLIYDRSEEIEKIEWTVSGKVLKVIRTTNSSKPNLEFTYDASGNRIAKKVIETNGDYKTTFYVRDASGNVMAVYKTSGTTNLTLEEQHIYGSSRLGVFKKDKTRKSTTRALGERQYELTDHLGNVRVVLIDYYKVGMSMDDRVLSATDYYPFGMVARSRTTKNNYRYGFNGKELDRDEEGLGGGGSTYDYGFRIYNPALARFLSVDPLTKSYPWYTPYQFAGNKPISHIDLDGLEEANVKTQTFSIKPELQPGDETTIDGQKYKVVSMTMINVSYFYSDHEGAWDQAGKDKGIPVSAEKLPAGYRQQGLYDIPVAYIIDYLSQGFSDPRIHGVTGDGFSGVARVKVYQNTVWKVVYELIPPPPPQPVPEIISPIVPETPQPINVNPVDPVNTPNNDVEIVTNQKLDIEFDAVSTDYDRPGIHFGDDPIDDIIDPIIKILNDNPQNYIELRVTTKFHKYQKLGNSKYPTAEALLKARADKIKQDFIRKGVDPTKIKIIIDDQSYNVPQAVHGKLHQFKKQGK